ncbi:hypothetical protein KEM54_006687 [Ascosphaera aggregata]|nr:hypothetical protein KEM54_006687 [Ascosphaera aggregata]
MAEVSSASRPAQAPPKSGPALTVDEEDEIRKGFEVWLLDDRNDSLLDTGVFRAEEKLDVCNVLKTNLNRLWESDSKYLEEASQAITTASRDESWRSAFGESGILDFYLRLLATEGLQEDILTCALKIASNTCAEMPDNRCRLLQGNYDFALLKLLDNKSLCGIVLVVIFNLCCEFGDYEQVRKQLTSHGLVHAVIKVLLSDCLKNDNFQEYAYNLLEIGISTDVISSPDDTLELLLDLADKPNQKRDAYIAQVNAICAHLENERFRAICIEQGLFRRVLELLPKSHNSPTDPNNPGEMKRLANARLVLNQSFSDISDQPNFSDYYPPKTEVFDLLTGWLERKEADLITCSCIVLGNIARNDMLCEKLVNTYHFHTRLITVLEREKPKASVAYSALGFLKNLAVPTRNRPILGAAGLLQAASSFWKHSPLPQLQMTSISAARLTTTNCFQNTVRLLEFSDLQKGQTYLSLLLEAHNAADSKVIRIESARAIAANLRNIGIQKDTPLAREATDLAERLFKFHKGLDKPISCLMESTDSPLIQGEAIIALTMSAQCKEGAEIATDCLKRESVFEAFRGIMMNPIEATISSNERKLRASNKANGTLFYVYLTQAKVKRS